MAACRRVRVATSTRPGPPGAESCHRRGCDRIASGSRPVRSHLKAHADLVRRTSVAEDAAATHTLHRHRGDGRAAHHIGPEYLPC